MERIWITRAGTVLGQALARRLIQTGRPPPLEGPEPTDARAVRAFLERTRPTAVVVAGGHSGGILANLRYPVDLMQDNLLLNSTVLPEAHRAGVPRLLYLASSCIYPRLAPQPLRVESLWTGPLEPTNLAYATARLAGLVLVQAFRAQFGLSWVSAIPTNFFGPGDHFDQEDSHVVPALLRRMHDARIGGAPEVVLWGTGKARREFLFVDDVADAALLLLDRYDRYDPINIGGGTDVSMLELASTIQQVVSFGGQIRCDPIRPDGMPLKALDAAPLAQMGWSPRHGLREGLEITYRWMVEHM